MFIVELWGNYGMNAASKGILDLGEMKRSDFSESLLRRKGVAAGLRLKRTNIRGNKKIV